MFTYCGEHVYLSPDSRFFMQGFLFSLDVCKFRIQQLPGPQAPQQKELRPCNTSGFVASHKPGILISAVSQYGLWPSPEGVKLTVIVIYYLHRFSQSEAPCTNKQTFFNCAVQIDKLFCIETVLLKLIEVGWQMYTLCMDKEYILEVWWGRRVPDGICLTLTLCFMNAFLEKELKSMTTLPINRVHQDSLTPGCPPLAQSAAISSPHRHFLV